MTIDQLAETDVVTADPDDGISDVVARMGDEGVGAVVVVEGDDPTGILTDRMVALAVGDGDVAGQTAGDLMTDDPVTVDRDDGVFEVIRTLSEEGIRRAPVVDDGGALAGIITLDDLVVLFADELDGLASVIKQQAPRF